MGNPILSGLPADVLPDQTAQDAAASTPVIRGTRMPLPPNMAANASAAAPAPEAPDTPELRPGSLADKIASAFLTHIAERQPAPPQNSEAGQRMSRAQEAVAAARGVMTSLGDAAHATDRPGGWLSGVTNTLNARNQRLSAEDQRKFDQQQEAAKNAALIAKNQTETLMLQRNIYRQDQEARESSYKQGATFVDSLRDKHDVTDGVTQDQLSDLIQKSPGYLQSHYVRQTGEEQVLDGSGNPKMDKNGNPVMSPIYSLVSRATKDGSPDTHEVSQTESDYIKKNIGQNIPVGTKLSVDQYTALTGRAHAVQNTTDMINKSRDEELSEDQKRQLSTLMQDAGVQHAIAAVPGKPLAGLYQFQQNADQHIAAIQQQIDAAQKKGDQNAVQQLNGQLQHIQAERQKIDRVITEGFSTADKEKYAAEVEKEKHDRAEEEERKAAAADRAAGRAQKKEYADAHAAWQKALVDNDFDPTKAGEALRKTNPKALAALADEEQRSQTTTTKDSDLLPGMGDTTTKQKPAFFTNLAGQSGAAQNNAGDQKFLSAPQGTAAVSHLDTIKDSQERWRQIMTSKSLSKDQKVALFRHYNYSVPTDAQFQQNGVR